MFGIVICLYLYSFIKLIATFVMNVGSDVASKVYDDYNSDARYAQRVKCNKGYLKAIAAFVIASALVMFFM